eukprot:2698072-Pleurochrysis_carterae.AAC.1
MAPARAIDAVAKDIKYRQGVEKPRIGSWRALRARADVMDVLILRRSCCVQSDVPARRGPR